MERIHRQAPLAGLVAICIAIPMLRDLGITSAGPRPQMLAIAGYLALAGGGVLFLRHVPLGAAQIGAHRPGWRSVSLGLAAGALIITPTWHRVSLSTVAIAWLVAAVALEEVLFRGILFAALQHAGGAPLAIAGSALVFTLAHAGAYGWPILVLVLLGGLYLGILRALTGDLWAAGVAHFLMDLGSSA